MDTSQHAPAQLLLVFLATATIAAWVYLWLTVRRGSNYGSSLAAPPQRRHWGPFHVCFVASIFLLLPAFVVQLISTNASPSSVSLGTRARLVLMAATGDPSPIFIDLATIARHSLLAAIAVCIFSVLTLIMFRFGKIADRRAIGCPRVPVWPVLLAGLFGFCLLALPVNVLQVLISQLDERVHPVIEQLRVSTSLDYFIVMTINVVLLAPIAEEIIFRVILQGWLETAIPVANAGASEDPNGSTSEANPIHWRAIAISSGLFAIVHFPAGLAAVIPLFIYAVGLGYVYQRTGHLASCVLMHMLLNALTMLGQYIVLFS